jgi:hypothetical protein
MKAEGRPHLILSPSPFFVADLCGQRWSIRKSRHKNARFVLPNWCFSLQIGKIVTGSHIQH